jgi:hypothetical protein
LRVVPSAQHGIASAAVVVVVVARMTGMLVGVAALSAWGLYRFNQIVATLSASVPDNASLAARAAAIGHLYRQAYTMMYGEIFKITALVCMVGALLGLLVAGRRAHAGEPQVPEQRAVAPRA